MYIGRNRKPGKEITTCLELETHFLHSLLNHGNDGVYQNLPF